MLLEYSIIMTSSDTIGKGEEWVRVKLYSGG